MCMRIYLCVKEKIKMSEKGTEKKRERIEIKICNVSNKIENVNHKSMNKSLIHDLHFWIRHICILISLSLVLSLFLSLSLPLPFSLFHLLLFSRSHTQIHNNILIIFMCLKWNLLLLIAQRMVRHCIFGDFLRDLITTGNHHSNRTKK